MRKVMWLTLITVVVIAQVAAAAGQAPSLDTTVKTVAAFKNGLAFVYRSGDAQLSDGWATMEELPPAALGAIWIGTTSPEASVEEVIAYKGTVSESVDALSLADLLEANVGKSVEIAYSAGGGEQVETIRGNVLSVPSREPIVQPAPAPVSYNRYSPSPAPEPTRGQIVLIKTLGDFIVALDKGTIRSIKLPADASVKTKIDRPANGARIRVRGKPKSSRVTLAYLEKGITWSPSYLINLLTDKEASITLDAVLANDVEDLEDADVSFVVGYPNFAFADLTTPLSVQQSVASFVQALLQGPQRIVGGPQSSTMFQSIAYNVGDYSRSSGDAWRPELAYSATQMPGETNEDLYFYHQPHVTLKKGDRAKYTVFTGKVGYEHIYLWEVPDLVNLDDRGYRQSGSRQDVPEDQVWHALKLQNTTTHPWTTAPALAVKGSMPVAQDTLKYTPPKGENTLKLTVATDIRAEQSENESARKVVNIGHDDYDEVTVDGTLLVKNMKPTAVKMNVKKMLTGEVLQSAGGKVSKVTKKLAAVNPKSEIEWDFDLAPGSERQLTYQYKILINR